MRARSSSSTCSSACCGILYGETHVTYVRNVTDVDDKINARALEHWTGKRALTTEIRALTDATLKQFQQDAAALGCLPPTHEPRATDYIATGDNPNDMVGIIARLIERGHAYVAEGHVLFDVASMPDYGALSRRSRGRHDRRRAGRGRALQARSDGLRALEAVRSRDRARRGPRPGGWGGPAGISNARR